MGWGVAATRPTGRWLSGVLPLVLLSMVALWPGAGRSIDFTVLIDANGDGVHALNNPQGVAVGEDGNVYVPGLQSNNVFKITPGGTITQIIDFAGDGSSNLIGPFRVAVDGSGNVYVTGQGSDNVFKITSGGAISEIIDATGDGTNPLSGPGGLAVDAAGNVYVTGAISNNVFKIAPGGGITQILDVATAGALDLPLGLALDDSSPPNVYVTGLNSNNAFAIDPAGDVTQLIDPNGDGLGNTLYLPLGIAVDFRHRIYIAGSGSSNLFEIRGRNAALVDSPGNDLSTLLVAGRQIDIDPTGSVYLTAHSDNVFRLAFEKGEWRVTEILDAAGDGVSPLTDPEGIAVGGSGTIYVTGSVSDNVFASAAFPLFGKKLLMKDKEGDPSRRKIVFLAKDSLVATPEGGDASDPRVAGATVRFFNPGTGDDATFTLPAGGSWTTLGPSDNPKGYKYKDTSGTNGPCKIFLAKRGKLIKVLCDGALGSIPYTLDEASQGEVRVEVRIGNGPLMCASFPASDPGDKDWGIGVDGKPVGLFKVARKEGVGPATCSP